MKLVSRSADMKPVDVRPGVTKKVPEYNPSEMRTSEWTFEPWSSTEPHAHDHPLLSYVVKGKMKVQLGDGPEETLGPGDYYFIPANMLRKLTFLETTTVAMFSPPY